MLFQKNLINLALNGSKTKSILAEIPLIADDNFNEVNDVDRPDKKMNYCVMDTILNNCATLLLYVRQFQRILDYKCHYVGRFKTQETSRTVNFTKK